MLDEWNSDDDEEAYKDLRILEELEDKINVETAKRIDKDIKKNGTIKWKDVKRELEL